MNKITSEQQCLGIKEGDFLINISLGIDYIVEENNAVRQDISIRAIGAMQNVYDNGELRGKFSGVVKDYSFLVAEDFWYHKDSAERFDVNKTYHGEDYAKDQQKFDDALIAIEAKHPEFFQPRHSRIGSDDDSLDDHIVTGNNHGRVWMTKFEHSDLPDEIYQECIAAFEAAFK